MKLRNVFLVITLSAFSLTALSFINQAPSKLNTTSILPEPEIKTINPKLYEISEMYNIPATLEAAQYVEVYSRANGYVIQRHVDIGSIVKKDQVLAEISSPELEDQIHQAKAEIRKQESLVELTGKLARRYEKLKNSGVVSIVDVEEKISAFQVAKAVLKNYKAKQDQLNEEYAYTKIMAPFPGVITQRFTEIGQRISADDQKPLFSLSRQNQLKVVVHIPQSKLHSLELNGSPQFYLDGLDTVINDLRYLRKSTVLSTSDGTMRVEYMVDNNILAAGMTGMVSLKQISSRPSYILPLNTLRMVDGNPTIHVVNGDEIKTLPVQIRTFMKNDVRIQGDISENEKIILNPNALLSVGNQHSPVTEFKKLKFDGKSS